MTQNMRPVGIRWSGAPVWEIEEVETADRYLVRVDDLDGIYDVGDEFDIEGVRYRLVARRGEYMQGIWTAKEAPSA